MKLLLPIFFASLAAIGNAMFALGQKKSAGADNGLLFVGLSALVAMLLSFACSPWMGKMDPLALARFHWKGILLSGCGLFLTYVGFNLLYSRFGVSQYILYAVISIISTTLVVGVWWLREPINIYHKAAVVLSLLTVVLFSLGQSKL
ncbi:MAG: hypothetical protein MI747_04230 [Desulfobacterales bacterium]|nr:hypothetical protein [Desulfobacterales bacterium]